MNESFDLDRWLQHHELDQPGELEQALREVPTDQRPLALLSWLHVGDLQGQRIHIPMR